MKFADLIHWGEAKLSALEKVMAPFAHEALKSGADDLGADAVAAVAEVSADPSLLTDAAKRDAATQAMLAKMKAQGVQIGENEVHGLVTMALSQAAAQAPKAATEPSAAT